MWCDPSRTFFKYQFLVVVDHLAAVEITIQCFEHRRAL